MLRGQSLFSTDGKLTMFSRHLADAKHSRLWFVISSFASHSLVRGDSQQTCTKQTQKNSRLIDAKGLFHHCISLEEIPFWMVKVLKCTWNKQVTQHSNRNNSALPMLPIFFGPENGCLVVMGNQIMNTLPLGTASLNECQRTLVGYSIGWGDKYEPYIIILRTNMAVLQPWVWEIRSYSSTKWGPFTLLKLKPVCNLKYLCFFKLGKQCKMI